MEESLKSLSMDYLNLLINGQAFSDVVFSVEGRLIPAHRCILAARSLFFRKFFCSSESSPSPRGCAPEGTSGSSPGVSVYPVNSVRYEVFMLLLQFLYSGQASPPPQKHEPRPDCGDRGCWHAHCTSAVDLALGTLAAARAFGVQQLALLTQASIGPLLTWVHLCGGSKWLPAKRTWPAPEKELAVMVEKASIEDVMKILIASRKQDMQQLWTTCSHHVAKSGLPPEVLTEHLPIDIVASIEELRLKSSLLLLRHLSSSSISHHHITTTAAELEDRHQKIHRMRRALDSSDVELVKLMVMGEGLNLNDALALHYAVANCSREVVKALLELVVADVNCAAGPNGRTPLHIAAEMVCPEMVAVLLDHHANPNVRTVDGMTPLDVLQSLTSEFLFRGAVPGLTHIEPNKLRLCLELVQSAAMVMSREEETVAAGNANAASSTTHASDGSSSSNISMMDSRMVYLNLGMATAAAVHPDGGVREHMKMT